MSYVELDANGQVIDPGATAPTQSTLQVSAITMQFTVGTGTSASVGAPAAYTRTGETIIFAGTTSANSGHYVRFLTDTTFTYEVINVRANGSVFSPRFPYHR